MQVRHVAATRANQQSSRSHTIFILKVTQKFPNESEKQGVLNLVDLAGSEKVGKTGATGETLEEAKKINSSLSAIGNVIHHLVFKTSHVPYRDSKLTRILQESLGGNYKTSLIVTCSTHSTHLEETISTLRFAQRARSIKNQVKINVKNSPQQLQAMIHQLKYELRKAIEEITSLRTQIDGGNTLERTDAKYLESEGFNVINEEPESPILHSTTEKQMRFSSLLSKLKPTEKVEIMVQAMNKNNEEGIVESKYSELPKPTDVISFLSREESNIGDTTEFGCLHNVPKQMFVKDRSTKYILYL